MIVSLRVLTWLIVLPWGLWLCWSFIGGTFEWWIIPLISPAFVTHRMASRLRRKREEADPAELLRRYQREKRRRWVRD